MLKRVATETVGRAVVPDASKAAERLAAHAARARVLEKRDIRPQQRVAAARSTPAPVGPPHINRAKRRRVKIHARQGVYEPRVAKVARDRFIRGRVHAHSTSDFDVACVTCVHARFRVQVQAQTQRRASHVAVRVQSRNEIGKGRKVGNIHIIVAPRAARLVSGFVVPVVVQDKPVKRNAVVSIALEHLAHERRVGVRVVPRPPNAKCGARDERGIAQDSRPCRKRAAVIQVRVHVQVHVERVNARVGAEPERQPCRRVGCRRRARGACVIQRSPPVARHEPLAHARRVIVERLHRRGGAHGRV